MGGRVCVTGGSTSRSAARTRLAYVERKECLVLRRLLALVRMQDEEKERERERHKRGRGEQRAKNNDWRRLAN